VNFNSHFRGGLPALSASLLFSVTAELLKWQLPIYAANEASIRTGRRASRIVPPSSFSRRSELTN
jgi:hypothetical protein